MVRSILDLFYWVTQSLRTALIQKIFK